MHAQCWALMLEEHSTVSNARARWSQWWVVSSHSDWRQCEGFWFLLERPVESTESFGQGYGNGPQKRAVLSDLLSTEHCWQTCVSFVLQNGQMS